MKIEKMNSNNLFFTAEILISLDYEFLESSLSITVDKPDI